jgi:hypothetical protein
MKQHLNSIYVKVLGLATAAVALAFAAAMFRF